MQVCKTCYTYSWEAIVHDATCNNKHTMDQGVPEDCVICLYTVVALMGECWQTLEILYC